jgi:ABC-type branched-subunit amino acid transport system ATPase component/branched-subunit amino acid ABC-type transport system permease component
MLPFIIIGLTNGAVYGLAAVGLVLTYKTTGIFNFALGALATVSAYVMYALFVQDGWSWVPAAAVAVLIAGPLMGLLLELIARRLQGTSLTLRIAATVGLLLAIEGALTLLYPPTELRSVPVFLGQHNVSLGGTNVQVAQILTFAFAVSVTAVVWAWMRFTRRGIAMRAVVDNPELLAFVGTSPTVTRRWAWVVGITLAAACGVLFAPLLPLDPVQLTFLVVAAFGAAAIGMFSSLPMSFAGGLIVGVLSALCTKWFTSGVLAGLAASMPFVVLFVVLLVFPKRRLLGPAFTVAQSRPTWQAPAAAHLLAGLVVLVALCFVPSFAGVHLTDWTTALALVVVFLGLGLLVRTSGQVSLAQVSFMAIGAAAFSHLTIGSGVPWFLALVLAGLIAVPIGALLAVPAIRLGGLYLALATLGFGLLLQSMFYSESFMFGASNLGLNMPRPGIAQSDTSYYFLVLALATAAAALVTLLNRGRLGRLLRGLADSPTALETNGVSVTVTKVIVFCLSAFLAAVGGALAGSAAGNISPESYAPLLSLTFFALIIIVAGREPWYAILAALGWAVVPSYVSGSKVSTVLQIVFGASAILVALAGRAGGEVPVPLRRAIDGAFGRVHVPALRRRGAPAAERVARVAPGELRVEHLTVRFGGVLAVDALDLKAPTGRITGLIGPNGAGKTTTFNACSGLVRPSEGTVFLNGRDVTRRGPAVRADLGLGRTFQRMELFESLTVRENVAIGAEGSRAGTNPFSHLISRRRDDEEVRVATKDALELCSLVELGDSPIVELSTGQRRLVELARCLAGPYQILLLDEPSSGLDHAETRRFGAVVQRVVQQRGIGVLLVEHDMSLVLGICEYIYVLDFGELVFQGTPAEVMASPVVQAAYLGDQSVEEAVSQEHKQASEVVA